MPVLHVVTGEGIIFDHSFTGDKLTLGRSKKSDLPLKDLTVSRLHAEIRKTDSGYRIIDLGSYNGTRLNGKRVQSGPLCFGDKVQLGQSRFTFLDDRDSETRSIDSLILTSEDDLETGEQRILQSIAPKGYSESRELLASLQKGANKAGRGDAEAIVEQTSFSDLARINKVLFVLYEISRQLNQINDFDELLKKIMDLIFVVIDADYGFLVLLGGRDGEELVPVTG